MTAKHAWPLSAGSPGTLTTFVIAVEKDII
jgi:hypothetical protein